MSIRLYIGLFLLKISYYLRRIYLVILAPRDLIASNKLQYERPEFLRSFGNPNFNLKEEEREVLEKYNIKKGRFLVLGCAGGRESIALAKIGLEVVGVDFVKKLIERAEENANVQGLKIVFEVCEITHFSPTRQDFDYAGIFSGGYSSIPTRKLRLRFLEQIKHALKDNGLFLVTFLYKKEIPPTYRTNILKAIGYLTLGNLGYQAGDELWGKYEFIHFFYNKDDVQDELEEGGFGLVELRLLEPNIGYAIARPYTCPRR